MEYYYRDQIWTGAILRFSFSVAFKSHKTPTNPLIDVARKKQFEKPLHGDKESVRFATPEPIARYRAQRLRCGTLADISCGIGGQTVFFAQQCEFVYAVEIDPEKIEYA
ncbi:MAG: methyltransferase, partial [Methanosarcina mazei]